MAQYQHPEARRGQRAQTAIILDNGKQDRQRDNGADGDHLGHRVATRDSLDDRVLQREDQNAEAKAENAEQHPVLHDLRQSSPLQGAF
jgi:hypothetical protein